MDLCNTLHSVLHMFTQVIFLAGNRNFHKNSFPSMLKFIYSEKARIFCAIFTLLLTAVKSKVKKGCIYFSHSYLNQLWFFMPHIAEPNFSCHGLFSWVDLLQVNLCKKLLFLHQLSHNMTTDCSLNYKFNTWTIDLSFTSTKTKY